MAQPRNIADLVRRAARSSAGPALIWQGHTMSWSEVDAAVEALARVLAGARLPASGERAARIAIALPNVPDFVIAYFGVLRAGYIVVPVNPGYTTRELRHLLSDSGASVLIGTSDVREAVAPVRAELPALTRIHGSVDELIRAFGAVPDAVAPDAVAPGGAAPGGAAPGGAGAPPERSGEDIAVLMYTSGTAGAPKGAMLSHRALLANLEQLARVEPPPLGVDDVVLLAVPFFHAYGLNSGLGAIAYHGACGVLVERFDPADVAALVTRHHVSCVVGVPTMYVAWSLAPDAAEAFGSVRLAVSGAAPLDPYTARRFLQATRCPIFEGYGLTETAPVLTSTIASPVPKTGSVGRPLPGVEIKLIGADGEEIWRGPDGGPVGGDDDDERLATVAPDSPGTDPGEVVARGDNLFSGYWPDGREGPDDDGWWATGDIAYADADGDLFLVDRLDELIIVNGFNVYPHEVELVLSAHPSLVEAAALGVANPYSGQSVKAFVVVSAPVTTEELVKHCERNLARFKCPSSIEFVEELPHSATGKVRKVALR